MYVVEGVVIDKLWPDLSHQPSFNFWIKINFVK